MGFDFQKIGQIIDQSGVSRKQFLKNLGMTEKRFDEWSRGLRIPPEHDIAKIAGALNVSLVELRENISAIEFAPKNAGVPSKGKQFASNFEFLERVDERLFFCGHEAELGFLDGHYIYTIVQVGTFGEKLIELMIRERKLFDFLDLEYWEQLQALLDDGQLNAQWFSILNKIRLCRNLIHRGQPIEGAKTLSLQFLKDAFEISKAFASKRGIAPDNPVFLVPSKVVREDEAGAKKNALVESQRENLDYVVAEVDGGICVSSYMGSDSVVEIPAQYRGKKIIAIGDQAFQNCESLKKVILPVGVTTIGEGAFAWCENLVEVRGTTRVKELKKRAFYRCSSLKSIDAMCEIEAVPKEAFAGCTSMKAFFFGENLKRIEAFAFARCDSLQEVIPYDGLDSIGMRAFAECSALSKVILPVTVTIIGEEAFNNCTGIKELSYPHTAAQGVMAFGEKAESRPKADVVQVVKDNPIEKVPAISAAVCVQPCVKDNAGRKKASQVTIHKKTLMQYFEDCGLEVYDKRMFGGCLWVVGSRDEIGCIVDKAKEIFSVGGTYCGGGRVTGYRPSWFTRAATTEARIIPDSKVAIDYTEIATAGQLYEKYFGKIDGPLILEDENWTNEYCFVVDRLVDNGRKLEGACYCKGTYQKRYSYSVTRKFRVFDGSTAESVARLHTNAVFDTNVKQNISSAKITFPSGVKTTFDKVEYLFGQGFSPEEITAIILNKKS